MGLEVQPGQPAAQSLCAFFVCVLKWRQKAFWFYVVTFPGSLVCLRSASQGCPRQASVGSFGNESNALKGIAMLFNDFLHCLANSNGRLKACGSSCTSMTFPRTQVNAGVKSRADTSNTFELP